MAHMLNVNRAEVALNVLRNLDIRREEGLYDFTITVQNQKIHAEQNVLVSGSDYFKAMLSHDTIEKENSEVEMH